jgi:YbbR domain-containing protein
MHFRDLLFHNLAWKLVALLLAMLAWTTLHSNLASRAEPAGLPRRLPLALYQRLPVRALGVADDNRMFRFDPPAVDVTVRGLPEALRNLDTTDVEVFVNVTGITNPVARHQRIEVAVPAGLSALRVSPTEVTVFTINTPTNQPDASPPGGS